MHRRSERVANAVAWAERVVKSKGVTRIAHSDRDGVCLRTNHTGERNQSTNRDRQRNDSYTKKFRGSHSSLLNKTPKLRAAITLALT
jgi:hypothetical protein